MNTNKLRNSKVGFGLGRVLRDITNAVDWERNDNQIIINIGDLIAVRSGPNAIHHAEDKKEQIK